MASATSLPVQGTRMVARPSLNQVLQSDSVRRLFSQPNIVIHAIPRKNSPTAFRLTKPNDDLVNEKNGINGEYQLPNKPEVSIQVINAPSKETSEEENLLPSKSNGKSEILLVPIVRKRKECGHFEPCESLTCDVLLQYEDGDGINPLVSVNITENEIDAPVKRHCENRKCDALSIDHDRCRRASIQLYQCDKCIRCDICQTTFQSRRARLNHKKCRRKNVYQHNNVSPSDVLKFRMRERELQILTATRLKRSCDYLDPVRGFSRTMEALTKNDELIIIPKMPPSQQFTFKPNYNPLKYNNNNNSNSNNYNNNCDSNTKSFLGDKKVQISNGKKELTSEMISNIILSCQNSIKNNFNKSNEKSTVPPLKQIKLSDHLNGATVNINDVSNLPVQSSIDDSAVNNVNLSSNALSQKPPFIIKDVRSLSSENPKTPPTEKTAQATGLSVNNIGTEPLQKLDVSNWVMNQSYMPPLKVVPIVELKSEPSLMHQTHGVPKFCVVVDSMALPKLVPKKKTQTPVQKPAQADEKPQLSNSSSQVLFSNKFRPLQPALKASERNVETKLGSAVLTSKKQKVRKKARKRKGKFKCTHCPKKFSSFDYCKLHIAKHENKLSYFCKLCKKGFLNKYDLNKHMDADHKSAEVKCEKTEPVADKKTDVDCLARSRSVRRRTSKEFFVCNVCERRFENEKQFQIHLANNPMKFTLCPDCGKKFHRKSECNEHSKTCSKNNLPKEQTSAKRKFGCLKEELNLKSDRDSRTQDSIDKKLKVAVEANLDKKLTLNSEKNVQKEEKSTLKPDVRIGNGLKKQNSSNCLNVLEVIKTKKVIPKEEEINCKNRVIKLSDKEILMLNVKQNQAGESAVFDKSSILSSIIQDHNYQALH